jgi:hypothetical protein
MNYRAGDEVICIDARPIKGGRFTLLKVGKCYKAVGFSRCCSQLVGEDFPGVNECPLCRATDQSNAFYAWRFIKLDGLKEEIVTDRTLVTTSQ